MNMLLDLREKLQDTHATMAQLRRALIASPDDDGLALMAESLAQRQEDLEAAFSRAAGAQLLLSHGNGALKSFLAIRLKMCCCRSEPGHADAGTTATKSTSSGSIFWVKKLPSIQISETMSAVDTVVHSASTDRINRSRRDESGKALTQSLRNPCSVIGCRPGGNNGGKSGFDAPAT
jgi:hypothetical protein